MSDNEEEYPPHPELGAVDLGWDLPETDVRLSRILQFQILYWCRI